MIAQSKSVLKVTLLKSVNHLDDQDQYKTFEIKVPDVIFLIFQT